MKFEKSLDFIFEKGHPCFKVEVLERYWHEKNRMMSLFLSHKLPKDPRKWTEKHLNKLTEEQEQQIIYQIREVKKYLLMFKDKPIAKVLYS